MAPATHPYHPHDAIHAAIEGTMVTGAAGTLISAIQNTLTRSNVSAWSVFTRSGSTIVSYAAMGGAFEFTKNASANLREKDDSVNAALGGFMSGAVLGLRHGTTPAVLGYGALAAVLLAAFDYTGGSLRGRGRDESVDEFDRKQHLRKNRRRPIEETISELGESRGIKAPGWEERRRERIKAKYGIDVPEVS